MRQTPFSLVFGAIAAQRFPTIKRGLAERGLDPRNRDAFLMVPEAVALIREMRPSEGMGDGMDQLVAFVHHAFLYWAGEQQVMELDRPDLDALLDKAPPPAATAQPSAWYVQLPERRVWARVLEDAAHEPLDGVFVHPAPGGALRVLGGFGLHSDRSGFSAVETEGPRPLSLERPDASKPFSTNLPGGAAAELYSLAGAEELLDLGWRTASLWSRGEQDVSP